MKFSGIISLLIANILVVHSIQASQTAKIKLDAGVDLASTYLWRGIEIGNGPVIQPWSEFSYKNLTGGIWASTNFTGDSKEIDLYVEYDFREFTFSFRDYFTVLGNGSEQNYFDFSRNTDHLSEVGLSFNGSDKIPIRISVDMVLYGLKLDPGPRGVNHSVYSEVAYMGVYNDYSYALFAGFVPFTSSYYETNDFTFINLGFKVGRSLQLTDRFELPINVTFSTRPSHNSVCLAVEFNL